MSDFTTNLTFTETSLKGWEISQTLKRKAHRPVNLTKLQDRIADRAVALHAAGNSRAITIGIFEAQATPAGVEAAITALV